VSREKATSSTRKKAPTRPKPKASTRSKPRPATQATPKPTAQAKTKSAARSASAHGQASARSTGPAFAHATRPAGPNRRPAGPKRSPAGAKESPPDRRARAAKIIARLKDLYPDATCALHHRSALELLVATILSAQCTDETVNRITPILFQRYPTAEALAAADSADIERIIHSCGFFRQKTRSIQGACREMVKSFTGQVPDTMGDLTGLPGVARKTANVILGTWFGKNDGVVVDTHIGRLSHRLGLTWTSKDEKDAVKIEQDLMEVLPREEWTYTGHALIWHGRRVCTARNPKCGQCTLNQLCPSAFTFDAKDEG
jgi:endonuclease-3